MRLAWIPEHPRLPLYRAARPETSGKAGERLELLTSTAAEALQFETRERCQRWIDENPVPVFVAIEHGFL